MNRLTTLFVLLLALPYQPLLAHPGAHASIAHYSRMIELQPENFGLYIQRGIAYSNDGQYPAALADLNLAAKQGDPTATADTAMLIPSVEPIGIPLPVEGPGGPAGPTGPVGPAAPF